MPSRWSLALLALAALLVPALAAAAPAGPPVPQSIVLPSKVVQGDSATGTVCLDRVPDTATEVRLFTDNSFAATVDPTSVVIAPPDQCASFTVRLGLPGCAYKLEQRASNDQCAARR